MADVYYDAQATGANNGSSKADAYQTEALALAATGAGDIIWSSHTSDEAKPGFNITGAGQKFISVDFTGSTPPVGADVTFGAKLTGSVGSDTIFTGTSIFYDGFYFFVGDDLKPDRGRTIMDNCTIELDSTNDSIFPGGGSLILNNPTFIADSVNTFINAAGLGGSVRWNGGTIVNPLTTLIQSFNLGCSNFEFNDADLSQVTTLVTNSTLFKEQQAIFKGCKLKSGYVLSVGNFGDTSFIALYGSHSSNILYFIQEQDKYGGIITETTVVKTGGSSDGVTPISLKFVTSADALKYILPLRNRLPILFYASTTGLQTFNVDVLTDGITLQDDEAWLETDVPGADIQRDASDSRPVTSLTTPADLPLSSEIWNTTGLSTPVKQTISITVDVKQVGWVEAHICFAKPSSTMYADLKILDGSPRQWLAGGPYINGEAAACSYPAETDVRDGVAFGDAGALIGNLESPSEADVLEPVQYGANGTEFTGTLKKYSIPTNPNDTQRQQIITQFEARMQSILIANGYKTDLGLEVAAWRDYQYPEDTTIALEYRDLDNAIDDSDEALDEAHNDLAVTVTLTHMGTDGATTMREMIGDVINAVGADDTFGGLAAWTKYTSDGMGVDHAKKKQIQSQVDFVIVYYTGRLSPSY